MGRRTNVRSVKDGVKISKPKVPERMCVFMREKREEA